MKLFIKPSGEVRYVHDDSISNVVAGIQGIKPLIGRASRIEPSIESGRVVWKVEFINEANTLNTRESRRKTFTTREAALRFEHEVLEQWLFQFKGSPKR